MPQSRTAIKSETFARAFGAQGLNAKKGASEPECDQSHCNDNTSRRYLNAIERADCAVSVRSPRGSRGGWIRHNRDGAAGSAGCGNRDDGFNISGAASLGSANAFTGEDSGLPQYPPSRDGFHFGCYDAPMRPGLFRDTIWTSARSSISAPGCAKLCGWRSGPVIDQARRRWLPGSILRDPDC
jgi:hypothetical protein